MGLTAAFLGVTTILISDGETSLITDGFFSRPGKLQAIFGWIAPNKQAIQAGLARARIGNLAAVLVGHSHYDHALDAPEVAMQTGARLVGSESTLNIGRGYGLQEERMQLVKTGEMYDFGKFRVRFILSKHNRTYLARGEIREALIPPAQVWAYRDGGCYTILVEHSEGSIIVQESAGFVPGALNGYHADTVFLAVSGISRVPALYRETYFRETLLTVGAKRVVPIHTDDFTRPLTHPPVMIPGWVDDIDAALDYLQSWAIKAGVRYECWEPYQPVTI